MSDRQRDQDLIARGREYFPEDHPLHPKSADEVSAIETKADSGEAQRLFEAKLLGFDDKWRIKLCQPCLMRAVAEEFVISSSAIPINDSGSGEPKPKAPSRSSVVIPQAIQAVVAEIKARRAKITAPPWTHYHDKLRPQFSTWIHEIQARGKAIISWGGFDGVDLPAAKLTANCEFIAKAPADIDTLLGIIESLTPETSDREFRAMLAEADTEITRLKQVVGWILDAADAAYIEDENNVRIHEIFNIAAKASRITRRLPDENHPFEL